MVQIYVVWVQGWGCWRTCCLDLGTHAPQKTGGRHALFGGRARVSPTRAMCAFAFVEPENERFGVGRVSDT